MTTLARHVGHLVGLHGSLPRGTNGGGTQEFVSRFHLPSRISRTVPRLMPRSRAIAEIVSPSASRRLTATATSNGFLPEAATSRSDGEAGDDGRRSDSRRRFTAQRKSERRQDRLQIADRHVADARDSPQLLDRESA